MLPGKLDKTIVFTTQADFEIDKLIFLEIDVICFFHHGGIVSSKQLAKILPPVAIEQQKEKAVFDRSRTNRFWGSNPNWSQ